MTRSRSGFTLIELMIVIAIIGAISAIALAGFLQIRRMANEKTTAASMKALLTGEETFKGTDADRNIINDYWTFDLQGLFDIQPSGGGGKRVLCISDYGMAFADLDPMNSGVYDNGTMMHPGPEPLKQPKAGYWFQTMVTDVSGLPLTEDTDASGVACHNFTRFGFVAIPVSYSVTGVFCFFLNEEGSVFKADFGTSTPTIAAPAVRAVFAPLDNVPDPLTLSTSWGKVE